MRRYFAIAAVLALVGFGFLAQSEAQLSQFIYPTPAAGGTFTTFDPSNQLLHMTLSGGNDTATCGTANCMARGTSPTTHGGTDKVYVEYTLVTVGGSSFDDFGLQNSSFVAASAGNIIGFDTTFGTASMAYTTGNGQAVSNGSSLSSGGNILLTCRAGSSGDILAMAFDFGAAKFWVNCFHSGAWEGWNKQLSGGPGNPDSGTVSMTFTASAGPYFLGVGFNTTSDAATVNTGATAFQQAPNATTFTAWH